MREIKFRAWDEDIKQMLPNVQAAYDTGYAESFGEVLRTKTQHVMQFTGLKDRNGRDIYEGDVCIGENIRHREDDGRRPMLTRATVVFRNAEFCLGDTMLSLF